MGNLLGLPAAVWGWLTGLPMLTLGLAIWGEASCMLIEHFATEDTSRSGWKDHRIDTRAELHEHTQSQQIPSTSGLGKLVPAFATAAAQK